MKCEGCIWFIYAQNAVFNMTLENDVAELSDFDSRQNAIYITHATHRRSLQEYSANTIADRGDCWNPM